MVVGLWQWLRSMIFIIIFIGKIRIEVSGRFGLGFRDTVSICLVTWFTSIFGGFAIFTVLGMRVIVGIESID